MDGNGKTSSDGLDELAVSICEDFLRRNGIGRIELYGGNPEVLLYMRQRMQKYFFDQRKPVLVAISSINPHEYARELIDTKPNPEDRPFPVNLDVLLSYRDLSREYPLKFPTFSL